ncbi:MAG: hypothetical protein EZS28_009542 [Streblomastix strix]|uniref:non-specific serine/threonine protein kinase n=1 Tax=Streblomastix strix TaxID=222440 RepID=A0A5J4WJ22_9EUKA|nr:MAG: hypothetical protein EZS28_009542 [Streblomastix strix]
MQRDRRLLEEQGLQFLGVLGKGAFGRDIKGQNILLHSPPGSGRVILKIADFGLVKNQDGGFHSLQMTVVGTQPYFPPEFALSDTKQVKADAKVDVWSSGIIFYQLATHVFPFNVELPNAFMKFHFRETLNRPTQIKDDVMWDLITRMLSFDRKKRFTAAEALNHEFFTGVQASRDITPEMQSLAQSAVLALRSGDRSITPYDTNVSFIFPVKQAQKIYPFDPEAEINHILQQIKPNLSPYQQQQDQQTKFASQSSQSQLPTVIKTDYFVSTENFSQIRPDIDRNQSQLNQGFITRQQSGFSQNVSSAFPALRLRSNLSIQIQQPDSQQSDQINYTPKGSLIQQGLSNFQNSPRDSINQSRFAQNQESTVSPAINLNLEHLQQGSTIQTQISSSTSSIQLQLNGPQQVQFPQYQKQISAPCLKQLKQSGNASKPVPPPIQLQLESQSIFESQTYKQYSQVISKKGNHSENSFVDYQRIIEIFKLALQGSKQQIESILHLQENECAKLILMIKVKLDEGRLNAINHGISLNLINIYETRDLALITTPLLEVFNVLLQTSSDIIMQVFNNKNPYPGLFRLIEIKDNQIILLSLQSICSLLKGGLDTTEAIELHPHYDTIDRCNGIKILYKLFKLTSTTPELQDICSICIGRIYRSKEVQDKDMRVASIEALILLAQNQVNIVEIMTLEFLQSIAQDLRKQPIGNELLQKSMSQKQEKECEFLQTILNNNPKNDKLRLIIIKSGIADSILNIFQNRELQSIALPFVHVTPIQTQHPNFSKFESCNEFQNLFDIFSKTGVTRSIKDISAVCIGNLFRAKQLPTGIDIISHLILLLNSLNSQTRISARNALNYLAQDKSNFVEIMKKIDLKSIAVELKKPLAGSEEQKKQIINKQELQCSLIYVILNGREDEQLLISIINTGIAALFLNIFEQRDLSLITKHNTSAFRILTQGRTEITNQLLNQKQFPSLLRLLTHKDIEVITDTMKIFFNIIFAANKGNSDTTANPYYDVLVAHNGVDEFYSIFKRIDICKETKDISAFCIGFLHRRQQIANQLIRIDVISYLKTLTSDPSKQTIQASNDALFCLALNTVNRAEIEKGGFKVVG